jgi:hypothetical protein
MNFITRRSSACATSTRARSSAQRASCTPAALRPHRRHHPLRPARVPDGLPRADLGAGDEISRVPRPDGSRLDAARWPRLPIG